MTRSILRMVFIMMWRWGALHRMVDPFSVAATGAPSRLLEPSVTATGASSAALDGGLLSVAATGVPPTLAHGVPEEVEAATYKHCQLYIRDAYTAISAACVADHESQATASGAATE